MSKEITITNANNFNSSISFRINGLEDGITVGIIPHPNSHERALSVSYKGEVKIVPLNANIIEIEKLNEDDKITIDSDYIQFDVTPIDEAWQPNQVTELDDEAYDKFEKEVMNPEPDIERVEAVKKIFEDVDKVINDIKIVKIVETPVNAKTYPLKNQEVWMREPVVLQNPEDFWKHEQTHYGEPHLLELMDEWGVDGTNYADFRSVIQEHCLSKGLYAFDDIEKAWKEHIKSLKEAVKSISKKI